MITSKEKHYKVGGSRGYKATHSTTTAILELESVWKWDFDRSLVKLRRNSEEEKRTRRSPPPYQWPSPGPIGQQSRGIISLRILKFVFLEKSESESESRDNFKRVKTCSSLSRQSDDMNVPPWFGWSLCVPGGLWLNPIVDFTDHYCKKSEIE